MLGFERCADLFTNNFKVGKIWMSWAERDGDDLVEAWKKEIGPKKKALAAAAQKLSTAVHAPGFEAEMRTLHRGEERLKAHQRFSAVLKDFADLQMSLDNNGLYAGPLAGMKIVKEKIAKGGNSEPRIAYWAPGQIIENIPGLAGVRIYVLGPPQNKASIAKETSSEEGETYDHNKDLVKDNAFAAAVNALGAANTASLLPFDVSHEALANDPIRAAYTSSSWRTIDHDWLLNAGSLALRINTGLNNLSLAIAIEFEKSGRVMLFPGDAEYGSGLLARDQMEGEGARQTRRRDSEAPDRRLAEPDRVLQGRPSPQSQRHSQAQRPRDDDPRRSRRHGHARLCSDQRYLEEHDAQPGHSRRPAHADARPVDDLRDDGLFFDAKHKVPLAGKIADARAEMSAAVGKAFKAAHQPPKKDDLFIAFRVMA